MSDINQNVNINVNANTQDASQDIEKLERNIATLDGAINIVGGSIEVLAGSLALTGAVTEEQAERFESAAVGAIALADGSKRIIEGYKTLASQTKVLTVVQRIYNTVLKNNPVFILVGVLAAVAAGVALLTTRLKAQREEQERLNAVTEQANKTAEYYDFIIKKAIARGESQFSVLSKQAAAQRARVRGLEDELKALEALSSPSDEQLERLKELPDLIEQAGEDAIIAQIKVETEGKKLREQRAAEEQKLRDEKARKEKEARDKRIQAEKEAAEEELRIEQEKQAKLDAFRKEQAQTNFEFFEESLRANIEATQTAEQNEIDSINRRYEAAIEYFGELETEAAMSAVALEQIEEAKEREIANVRKKYRDQDLKDEEAKEQAKRDIQNVAIDAAQVGLEVILGESKALAKAQVLIDAAQASVAVYRSAFDPTNLVAKANPTAYIAANLAFIAATAAKAIQQINSSDSGAGAPSGAGGAPAAGTGLSGPGFALMAPQIGGTSGVNTLQAIVLAGDVTSAQAQDAAIRNRRRFG